MKAALLVHIASNCIAATGAADTFIVDVGPDVVAAAAPLPVARVVLRDPLLRLLHQERRVHHPPTCAGRYWYVKPFSKITMFTMTVRVPQRSCRADLPMSASGRH